jgi:hypothetical protein
MRVSSRSLSHDTSRRPTSLRTQAAAGEILHRLDKEMAVVRAAEERANISMQRKARSVSQSVGGLADSLRTTSQALSERT